MVTGLQTQGGLGEDKAVTEFKVKTGTTECSMDYIKENGNTKVLSALYSLCLNAAVLVFN